MMSDGSLHVTVSDDIYWNSGKREDPRSHGNLLIPKTHTSGDQPLRSTNMTTKVLMVLSSAPTTPTGKQAGWYLPEAAHVCAFTHTVSNRVI